MSEPTPVTVTDNPERHRFEAADDSGVLAGFVEYARRDGTLELVHTEVDDAFQGRGVGAALVQGVLDELRGHDARVAVSCPFISTWLEKHPDYQDVTAP